MSAGHVTRPTTLAALGLAAGILLGGCVTAAEGGSDQATSATQAPVPEPDPSPTGAPVLTADGTPAGDDDADQDDDDEKGSGMLEPSAFPGWMTRPSPDASLCPSPTTRVTDAEELQAALDAAGPGTVIAMEPGVYRGEFVVTASGTAQEPAALCGPADAVLDGGATKGGYVLHLDGAQHWVLAGFTVRNGQKGVMADGTTGSTISGLTVYGIGDEAVHLRRHSTDNLVAHNTISDTGLRKEKFGEGVYVGTAVSNWEDITDGEPDASDRNRVIGNAIYATSSESVDVKEGTSAGVVSGNQFDGSTITGADSWVDVKGNDWTVTGNVGRHTPLDGFQTHEVADGWGTRNTFTGNSGELDTGEGFLIALRPERDNLARCDNELLGDVGAVSTHDCR